MSQTNLDLSDVDSDDVPGAIRLARELQARIADLYDAVTGESRPCRLCHRRIWVINTLRGRVAYDMTGRPHAEGCPLIRGREAR